MVVVTRRRLREAMSRHPESANDLRAWMTLALAARWKSMADVVQTFKDADEVDGYTIFDIRHNRYRLVTVIHYSKWKGGKQTQGHIYIRSLPTHKEYDNRKNWDRRFKR
jgi:mRNA interferase HigB